MRHLKNTKKLKRTEEERSRLKKDLIAALVRSQRIRTTTVKAKWFRPFFERLVTLCKRAGLDVQLQYKRLRPYLNEDDSRVFVEKLMPKFACRNGGYTRQYHYVSGESPDRMEAIVLITESTDDVAISTTPIVEAKSPKKILEDKKDKNIVVESKPTNPKTSTKDDLKKIEGIGPKIEELLNNAGILTFSDLANAKITTLEEILDLAGPRFSTHKPASWSAQSELARDGKWEELKTWQDELDGGLVK
jgi:large subunit ribosomal protein L17